MDFKFVDKNPKNVDGCFWIAKLEISKAETLVFGVDPFGELKIYIYTHILRSMQATDPAYRLHSYKGLIIKGSTINKINIEIGETTRTFDGNPLAWIMSKYNIFETKKGIHIAERKNKSVWKTIYIINRLETNLLKARMKSFSKKVKAEIEGEENELIGHQ
jgi:hypothetical protein